MIEGRLSSDAREAIIALQVFGEANGRVPLEVRAVIDTGFTGYLTLPGDTIEALSLLLYGSREVILADGAISVLDVYRTEIIWHDGVSPISVLKAEGAPLVGVSLLRGSVLTVDVAPGGTVQINRSGRED